jgi:O-antigen ligase
MVGVVGGVAVTKHPTYAAMLCLAIVGVIALATLGDRAFPWMVVIVAVAPWYPLLSASATAPPPVVSQRILCAAIVLAPTVPWIWSVASRGPSRRHSATALLLGLVFLGLAVLIHEELGSFNAMIYSSTAGLVFGGVAFACARKFVDSETWPAAAFAGLAILALFGTIAAVRAPGERVGTFVGYPITYGALIVALAPLALVFAARRSRLLTLVVAAATVVLLVLSESRSAWTATLVLLVFLVALLVRRGQLKALVGVVAFVALAVGIILSTGALSDIINERLGADLENTQAVVHRSWSIHYAGAQIGERPLFGAGAPGFAAAESLRETGIGALDNGYLSISVDLGLVGLLAVLAPIFIALWMLARCLWLGLAPPADVALALGVVGLAIVTIFYDGFYWAQMVLLLFSMGGILSTRIRHLGVAQRRLSG